MERILRTSTSINSIWKGISSKRLSRNQLILRTMIMIASTPTAKPSTLMSAQARTVLMTVATTPPTFRCQLTLKPHKLVTTYKMAAMDLDMSAGEIPTRQSLQKVCSSKGLATCPRQADMIQILSTRQERKVSFSMTMEIATTMKDMRMRPSLLPTGKPTQHYRHLWYQSTKVVDKDLSLGPQKESETEKQEQILSGEWRHIIGQQVWRGAAVEHQHLITTFLKILRVCNHLFSRTNRIKIVFIH